jgi:selT/selW/selH-like putative selenoprotein
MHAELIQGSGGIFDVAADGTLVYSKHRTGHFPENAEVLQALRTLSKG